MSEQVSGAAARDTLHGPAPLRVLTGDCIDVLRALPPACIDALVTDPPAGIHFMNKAWDGSHGGRNKWIFKMQKIFGETCRVLKPGAHGLVWALPRTSHWTATALEDAGFEIRDVLTHIFATGFPKSLNLGDGRGTALKPASEHWVLVRAPLEDTTTANVERWGTGGLEIDACRIGTSDDRSRANSGRKGGDGVYGVSDTYTNDSHPAGRWPANVVYSHTEWCGDVQQGGACVDGCPVLALDEQSGVSKSGVQTKPLGRVGIWSTETGQQPAGPQCGDRGGASRFFFCAKPSPGERDYGLEGFEVRATVAAGDGKAGRRNNHPTVKSIALMRYLCRLVTPPGGIVLDPFAGSGTTGCAAALEGLRFLGIEQEPDYAAIARARIAAAQRAPMAAAPRAGRRKT